MGKMPRRECTWQNLNTLTKQAAHYMIYLARCETY